MAFSKIIKRLFQIIYRHIQKTPLLTGFLSIFTLKSKVYPRTGYRRLQGRLALP